MRSATLATFLALVLLPPSGASTGQKAIRDWEKYPAVVELDADQDIFVIGDVHGDYDRLVKLLLSAGIISRPPADSQTVDWSAGMSIVVFTGDMIDKGDNSLGVLRLIRALRDAASAKGGTVIALMGNHEAEFLADPGNRKAVGFVEELRAAKLDPVDVAACRGDIGRFLCSLPFAARVRDWFFAHAGNTHGRSLEQLKRELRSAVEKDGFATPELIGRDSILESQLRGRGEKPWFESRTPGEDDKRVLDADAAALGVAHLVQGHEPARIRFADGTERGAGEMFQRYGALFLVDTGMSKGIDKSQGAILHIKGKHGKQAVALCADGTETPIWDAAAKPPIGKAAPCGR
jgi:hypothetical protein